MIDQEQQSRWQPTRRQLLWAGVVASAAFLIIVICGYLFEWKWTGLPKRTLWDWLKLLIVPVVLAFGGYLFNRAESRRAQQEAAEQHRVDQGIANQRVQTDQAIAHQHRQDEALQAYLDNIGALLLDKDRPLREASRFDEVVTLARSRTLTVLRRLDGERKGRVLQFLMESNLIIDTTGGDPDKWFANIKPVLLLGWENYLGAADFSGARLLGAQLPYVNLSAVWLVGADLRFANLHSALLFRTHLNKANLHQADLSRLRQERRTNLSHAHLEEANMSQASLSEANLEFTNLSKANLREANLSGARLKGANLSDADLSGANLAGADLSDIQGGPPWGIGLDGADFSGADLTDADLTGADLRRVQGLTYEQVEKAIGRAKGLFPTKLPAELDHPDSWHQLWENRASPEETKEPPPTKLARIWKRLGRLMHSLRRQRKEQRLP